MFKTVEDEKGLKTLCGTLDYLAPEVFPSLFDADGYSYSVDVIALKWLYGLPSSSGLPTDPITGTCEKVEQLDQELEPLPSQEAGK